MLPQKRNRIPITITAEEIRKYATQFDPQPYHTDRSAAEGSIFGGLCASGWHVCAIMMKLLSNVMAKENIMLIGSDNVPSLKWRKPAFEGNKLHAELEFKDEALVQIDLKKSKIIFYGSHVDKNIMSDLIKPSNILEDYLIKSNKSLFSFSEIGCSPVPGLKY